MKKLFLTFLMTILLSFPVFATQRAQLDDGNGNILGTAANPIHTTGGSGGSSGSVTYTVCASDKTGSYNCDYTATGTNDQTQINAAIVAANALTTGGKVLLTEGHFYIGANNTPIKAMSNVWIQGSGKFGTTILVANGNSTMNATVCNQSNCGLGTQVVNFKISDLKIDNSAQTANGGYSGNGKGIAITNGYTTPDKNIDVTNIWVYKTVGSCIATDGTLQEIISNNLMDNCGKFSALGTGSNGYPLGGNGVGYGVGSTGSNLNIVVSNNVCINTADACILFEAQSGTTVASYGITVTGNVDSGSYNTVRLDGISGVTITGNFSYNTVDASYAVVSNTFAQVPTSDNNFSGNVSQNAGGAGIIVIAPFSSDKAVNYTISNNIIDTPTTYGINFESGYTNVQNNIIQNAGEDGIYWLAGQTLAGLNIQGNTIVNSGTASTSTHQSAINLKTNSTFSLVDSSIMNNLLKGSTGYALTTELSSGTFTNIDFKNNDLVSNALGTINSSLLTVGTNFNVFGNHGYTTNNFVEGNLNIQTNVGIGSLSPGEQLDINGTARMTGFIDTTSPTNGYVLTSDANGNGTWEASGITGAAPGGTNAVIYNSGSSTFAGKENVFSMDGTNVGIGTSSPGTLLDVRGTVGYLHSFQVNSSGNVSIGSTNAPARLALTEDAAESNASGMYIVNNGGTAATSRWWVDSSGNTRADAGSSANNLFVIDGVGGSATTGLVSIGTTATLTTLTVSGSPGSTLGVGIGLQNLNGQKYAFLANGSTGGTNPSGLDFYDTTNSARRISITSAGNVGIGTTVPSGLFEVGVRKFDILSTGNVGINSISPNWPLDVQGTVRATGFTSNGNIGVSGTGGTACVVHQLDNGIVTSATCT